MRHFSIIAGGAITCPSQRLSNSAGSLLSATPLMRVTSHASVYCAGVDAGPLRVADSNDPALLLKRRDGHVLAPPAMIEKWRMTEPAGDGVVFNNGWSQGSSATPMMVRPEVLHGKIHEIDAVGAGGVESAFV